MRVGGSYTRRKSAYKTTTNENAETKNKTEANTNVYVS